MDVSHGDIQRFKTILDVDVDVDLVPMRFAAPYGIM